MSRKHRGGMDGPKPMVPITPMLDLTFQLLFFFITLFDPGAGGQKFMEGQMEMSLPAPVKKENKGAAADPSKVKPDELSRKEEEEDPLDIPADLTVVVRTQLDGSSNGSIS